MKYYKTSLNNLYLITFKDKVGVKGKMVGVVVAATDEEAARNMHPHTGESISESDLSTSRKEIKVKFLGASIPSLKQGIVLSSLEDSGKIKGDKRLLDENQRLHDLIQKYCRSTSKAAVIEGLREEYSELFPQNAPPR